MDQGAWVVRRFAVVLLAAALVLPVGLVASAAGADVIGSCAAENGTFTFSPPLPPSGSTATVDPTLSATGTISGCTFLDGVTSGNFTVPAWSPFGEPVNCDNWRTAYASTEPEPAGTVTWNTGQTSTLDSSSSSGSVTGGLFQGATFTWNNSSASGFDCGNPLGASTETFSQTSGQFVSPGPGPLQPGRPTHVSATATNEQAIVRWTAPANTGGGIAQYIIQSSAPSEPLIYTALGTQTSQVINGLIDGGTYIFTVTAANKSGMKGPTSAPARAVRPSTLVRINNSITLSSIDSTSKVSGTYPCPGEPVDSHCFSIQQNFFVVDSSSAGHWVQNLFYIEQYLGIWWVTGAYEVWDFGQGTVQQCSTGPPVLNGCLPSLITNPGWVPISYPTTLKMLASVKNGELELSNSLGDSWPLSFSTGSVDSIFNSAENTEGVTLDVPHPIFYFPEIVLVGGEHAAKATFSSPSGNIDSTMSLADGRTFAPNTQCVATAGLKSPNPTSTGETETGLSWTSTVGAETSNFRGTPPPPRYRLGEGIKMLPSYGGCVG